MPALDIQGEQDRTDNIGGREEVFGQRTQTFN